MASGAVMGYIASESLGGAAVGAFAGIRIIDPLSVGDVTRMTAIFTGTVLAANLLQNNGVVNLDNAPLITNILSQKSLSKLAGISIASLFFGPITGRTFYPVFSAWALSIYPKKIPFALIGTTHFSEFIYSFPQRGLSQRIFREFVYLLLFPGLLAFGGSYCLGNYVSISAFFFYHILPFRSKYPIIKSGRGEFLNHKLYTCINAQEQELAEFDQLLKKKKQLNKLQKQLDRDWEQTSLATISSDESNQERLSEIDPVTIKLMERESLLQKTQEQLRIQEEQLRMQSARISHHYDPFSSEESDEFQRPEEQEFSPSPELDLSDVHNRGPLIPKELHEDEILSQYICPITGEPILHPVLDPTDGITIYERSAIIRYLIREARVSPKTRKLLTPMQLILLPDLEKFIASRIADPSTINEDLQGAAENELACKKREIQERLRPKEEEAGSDS